MSAPPTGSPANTGGGNAPSQAEGSGQAETQRSSLIQHVTHPIATIGQRFWALLIDLVLVSVVTLIIWLILAFITLELGRLEMYAIGVLGLSILYFILFESMDGQTIGKKLLRIKVVSTETMKKPTLGAVIIRNVLRIVDAFPPNFYIVGFIIAILNDRHQRAGDLLARTIVVREEEKIA